MTSPRVELSSAASPDDLRVAVLGVGKMGAFHVDSLSRRTRGARVTVVSDFVDEQAHRVGDPVGARVVADPLEAIRADDVDAVVLASPGAAHHEQVLVCLEAGKPVLCEKPLTVEASTSLEVYRRESDLGRRLIQVGFMRRFDHEYARLQRMIAAGEFGAPLMLHCTHRNPDVPNFFDSQFMIRDSVVHEADTARFLLGEEIAAVSVVKGRPTSTAPAGTSDPMLVLFEAVSGALVTIEIFVRTGVAYEVRTELVGERGSATIGLDQNVVVKRPGGTWGGTITPGFVERFGQAYDDQMQRWADAARAGIASGGDAVDGPGSWDGYAAAAICEAGVAAVVKGVRVETGMDAR
ncbi:Gfo/Idh/MocA family protein [Actinomycetospora chiangmaiensis]|uniref:Gfo/Idh/MocA family protein n=1 Tax=Actinomycetospora chiangmaiensis TaxID=402650 RepID=UPI00036F9714|nr:Gfo/Idh/MocA family oxidoreductase [Actinomycetospora chiangmaiensis]